MLRTVVAVAAASLSLAVVVRGQAACTNACSYTDDQGNVYDFSSLQGQELTTTDPSDTYYMNICGESSTTCPDDPSIPPVTSGMVVQSATGGGCWVLGVYPGAGMQECTWSSLSGSGQNGVQLFMANGSPNLCGGIDRQVTVNFLCPSDKSQKTDNAWTVTNEAGTCAYTVQYKTCLACIGGCTGGGGGGGGGGGDGGGGLSWGGVFCIIILGVALPLYLVGGIVYNMKVKGTEGVRNSLPNRGFWGKLCGLTADGVRFTVSLGKYSPSGAGTSSPYTGIGGSNDKESLGSDGIADSTTSYQ